MRRPASLLLLASAFSPLLTVLALVLRPFDDWWWNVALAAVFAMPSIVPPIAYRQLVTRLPTAFVRAERIRRRDGDVLSLLSSFVLPTSIALFVPDVARTVATVTIAALLAVVYAKAQLLHLNPMLIVWGFRLYAIERDGVEHMLVSRRRSIARDEPLTVVEVQPGLFLETQTRTEDPHGR